MRWHRQNGIPDNPDFEPEAEGGWAALPEPPPEKLQIHALVPLALTLPLFALAWLWLLRASARDFGPIGAVAGLLVVLPLVVVHEGIHLLLHPGQGRSPQSVLGASSKHGIIYAMYFGEMSRKRYVAVLLGPFVVLSVLPLLACAIAGRFHPLPALTSLWNTLFACGDLLGAWLILRGSPPGARLRNRGYHTWWRMPR